MKSFPPLMFAGLRGKDLNPRPPGYEPILKTTPIQDFLGNKTLSYRLRTFKLVQFRCSTGTPTGTQLTARSGH